MVDAAPGQGPIAIVCGGGSLPGAVAEAVRRRGREPVMFGLQGWADEATVDRYAHHWIAVGQIGRFFRLAHAAQCRDVLMIGTLLRPPLRQLRLDWKTIRMMPRIVAAFRGGDDRLLGGVARLMENAGFRVIGVGDAAPEVFVPEGPLGSVKPSERDTGDIVRGLKLIAALGPFDVGQAAVVANNVVLGGHVSVGDFTFLGGHVAIHQHVRLGEGVMMAGMSAARDDIIPFGFALGQTGALVGLNIVGLRRRGVPRAQMHRLRNAYRSLFFVEGRIAERIDAVEREFTGDVLVGKVIAFIRAGGRRPLMRPRARHEPDGPGDAAA